MEKSKPQKQRKPRRKKEKLPFWKTLGPEAESIFRHIGKAADNMTHSQWTDIGLNAILGALSYHALAPSETVPAQALYDIEYDSSGYFPGPQGGYPVEQIVRVPEKNVTLERLNFLKAHPILYPNLTSTENIIVPEHQEKRYSINGLPNALVGPIALKLAMTDGGTPPVSQIAGLAVLAYLGFDIFKGNDLVTEALKGMSDLYVLPPKGPALLGPIIGYGSLFGGF